MPDDLDPQTLTTSADVAAPGGQAESISTADVGGAPASAGFDFSGYLAEQGVPKDGLDPRLAADELLNGYRQYYQHKDLLPQVQNYLADQQSYQAWKQQQEQAQRAEQEKAAAEKKFKWEAKKYDHRWDSLVRFDPQTGTYRPVLPDSPEALRAAQARNEYSGWQRDALGNILENFPQLTQQAVADYVQQQINQAVTQLHNHWQAQQQMAGIYQANQQWLHAQGEDGQLQQNQFSPIGQQYLSYLQQLPNANLADPRVQDWLAQRLAIADQNMEQFYAAQAGQGNQGRAAGNPSGDPRPRGPGGQFLPVEPTGAEKKARFLDKRRGTRSAPNRDGAAGTDEEDENLDFEAIAHRELRKIGAVNGTG